MGRKGWSAGVAPASVDDSRVSSGRKSVLWENTKLSSRVSFSSCRIYGAQSHVFYTVAYCGPIKLPSLIRAPIARGRSFDRTRKHDERHRRSPLAHRRAPRARDPQGRRQGPRGTSRSSRPRRPPNREPRVSRISPEWLACVGVARGALRRAETPRLPAATARLTRHDPNPCNHETQARVTVMAHKQVRLGAAIHARPEPRATAWQSRSDDFVFYMRFQSGVFVCFPKTTSLTSFTNIIHSHHDSRAKTGGARR